MREIRPGYKAFGIDIELPEDVDPGRVRVQFPTCSGGRRVAPPDAMITRTADGEQEYFKWPEVQPRHGVAA